MFSYSIYLYVENSTWPSTDPCGTPAVTLRPIYEAAQIAYKYFFCSPYNNYDWSRVFSLAGPNLRNSLSVPMKKISGNYINLFSPASPF